MVNTLARETGTAAQLAVLEGGETLFLLCAWPGGRRDPCVTCEAGVRLPAHLTAAGRAALMHQSPAQLRATYPPGRPLAADGERGHAGLARGSRPSSPRPGRPGT